MRDGFVVDKMLSSKCLKIGVQIIDLENLTTLFLPNENRQ
jgi:hypothetical protein